MDLRPCGRSLQYFWIQNYSVQREEETEEDDQIPQICASADAGDWPDLTVRDADADQKQPPHIRAPPSTTDPPEIPTPLISYNFEIFQLHQPTASQMHSRANCPREPIKV